MLFEEPGVQELLRRVVFQVCHESACMEDLIQVATIHLWLVETKRPAQTLSWYMQSCRFHLLNHLACGRSVDSYKRRQRVLSIYGHGETRGPLERWERDNAVAPAGSGREIFLVLNQRLAPAEQRILEALSRGFGVREIGCQLGISHQAVSKHRGNIAAVATRLGISSPPRASSYNSRVMRLKPREAR